MKKIDHVIVSRDCAINLCKSICDIARSIVEYIFYKKNRKESLHFCDINRDCIIFGEFAATCNLHHCMFMKVGRAVIPKEVRSILKSEPRNANDIIIAAALIVSVHQDDRGQERSVQIIVVRFTATFESTGVSCLVDKDYRTNRKRSLVSRKSWLNEA